MTTKSVICCLTRGYNDKKNYDTLIRRNISVSKLPIVIVNENCKDPIEYCQQRTVHYVCPFLMNEQYSVIDGLDRFVNQSYESIKKVPATHTQMIHISYYINNPEVKEYITKIDKCGCILHNRWGDAPLMGILVKQFTKKGEYDFEWKGFTGYHGSHKQTY